MFNLPPHPSLDAIKPQTDATLDGACRSNQKPPQDPPIDNSFNLQHDPFTGAKFAGRSRDRLFED
jgi:hypothetical protein